MKNTYEICVDIDSSQPGEVVARLNQVLEAIGHDPVDCALVAASTDAIVNGRIENILWCDTRILGFDILGFRDGHTEIATAENIDAWFREQGHRLMKIEGFKAFGNTIIRVQTTDVDEAATRERKTTLMRPSHALAKEVVAERLGQMGFVALAPPSQATVS